MKLIPVDPHNPEHLFALYDMLAERTPEQSISHKGMPTYDDHVAFVQREPHAGWYLVTDITKPLDGGACCERIVGNIYVSKHREVGIHIRARDRGFGYGTEALQKLRELHPGPLLAHINPRNQPSLAFFARHGGRLIEHTYEL